MEPDDFWEYKGRNSSDDVSPPSGRSMKVYVIIMIIGAVLGAINEVFGAMFIIFASYLAWMTS